MSIRFRPRLRNHGFDDSEMPEIQIIPLGEFRTIIAAGRDHQRPRIRPGGPVKMRFDATWPKRWRGRLELEGAAVGRDHVEWVKDLKSTASVANADKICVEVLPQIQIRIAFNFVGDGPGSARNPEETSRKHKVVDDLIADANRVLQPQVNMVLIRSAIHDITLDREFGKVIEVSNKRPSGVRNWKEITGKGDANAQVNVFFVWDLSVDDAANEDTVGAARPGDPNIIIDDKSPDPRATLAHELLHVFGHAEHSTDAGHLMAPSGEQRGLYIPAKKALLIHAFTLGKRYSTMVTDRAKLINFGSGARH